MLVILLTFWKLWRFWWWIIFNYLFNISSRSSSNSEASASELLEHLEGIFSRYYMNRIKSGSNRCLICLKKVNVNTNFIDLHLSISSLFDNKEAFADCLLLWLIIMDSLPVSKKRFFNIWYDFWRKISHNAYGYP